MKQSPNNTENNRAARDAALARVSPAVNLAPATVTYSAAGPVLLLGPEHRLRIALSLLDAAIPASALITEAMPQRITPAMERAAALPAGAALRRLPVASLKGYLGRFDLRVRVGQEEVSLARLDHGVAHFAAVLDLGDRPLLDLPLKPAGYLCAGDDEIDSRVAELAELQGEFEKPRYVRVNNEICAHSSAELTGCTRCLDLCPADAIRVVDFQVQVDDYLCHGAGGCTSACPTGALSYAWPRRDQLLQQCRRLLQRYREEGGSDPCLLLHDAESGARWFDRERETLDPRWLPLQLEETGSAGPELWLSALAWGAAEVALLLPPELPEQVRSALTRELATVQAMLFGLGLGERIRLVDGDGLLGRHPSLRALSAPDPGCQEDKRAQIGAAMDALAQAVQYQDGARIPLPSHAPFGAVLMDEARCTLCSGCATVCPTGAIKAGPDQPRISFAEADCVQCGLCVSACPEKALSRVPSWLTDGERRRSRRILKEEEPFCCIRCGQPFATRSAVAVMLEKLAGHSMFAGAGLERLKMCGDCRVKDLVQSDPGADLFEFAQGRPPAEDDLNLATEVKG